MEHHDFLTVVQVSRRYDVSARMLRHYEQMGLIHSRRIADYAYRVYDEEAVERIRLILLLRKLRIPLKDIAVILADETHVKTLDTLQQNIAAMDDELAALTLIRDAVALIAARCRMDLSIRRSLADGELARYISTLPAPAKHHLQEVTNMSAINTANEVLASRTDVRIMQLPPCEVASLRTVGENPEETVGDAASRFVQETHLYDIKPDARMFGFNSPNPGVLEDGIHGYEIWLTLPEGFPLPEGVTRKRMEGGLYAVLTIKLPEFHRWMELAQWVENSPDYEPGGSTGPENMFGGLEEHLNWVYSAAKGWPENGVDGQLDLMMPIRKREK